MHYKSLVCSLVLSWGLSGTPLFAQHKNVKAVNVIFDTDIGPDYDDVGAITLLHALANRGEAHILATLASNKYEGIAAVIDVFNTYFGRPDIPIGVPKSASGVNLKDSQHWTDSLLAKYPHKIKYNNEVPDAVEVYRKVLAAQPDQSVTIVTVGFLTNLYHLLSSAPDKYSPLNGKALVEQKVKKLVTMAGKFPSGKEFNMDKDPKASRITFAQWPTKVLFSGFEIGAKIHTGLPLVENSKLNSPAKDVFRIALPKSPEDARGRMSWDEITTLVAIRGINPFFIEQSGTVKINDDGSNSWEHQGDQHAYLVAAWDRDELTRELNELMSEQAKK